MAGDLKPGDVTTLGNLRPGDVGEWSGFGDGAPKFVVVQQTAYPGFGVCVDALYDGGGSISEPFLSRPVRYLGRGRIEPAKIVMDSEPDRVAELADAGKIFSRLGYSREAAEMQEVADAMGEQQRRIAELESQVRTLRETVDRLRLELGYAETSFREVGMPGVADGFAKVLAATAPKGERR